MYIGSKHQLFVSLITNNRYQPWKKTNPSVDPYDHIKKKHVRDSFLKNDNKKIIITVADWLLVDPCINQQPSFEQEYAIM